MHVQDQNFFKPVNSQSASVGMSATPTRFRNLMSSAILNVINIIMSSVILCCVKRKLQMSTDEVKKIG